MANRSSLLVAARSVGLFAAGKRRTSAAGPRLAVGFEIERLRKVWRSIFLSYGRDHVDNQRVDFAQVFATAFFWFQFPIANDNR